MLQSPRRGRREGAERRMGGRGRGQGGGGGKREREIEREGEGETTEWGRESLRPALLRECFLAEVLRQDLQER